MRLRALVPVLALAALAFGGDPRAAEPGAEPDSERAHEVPWDELTREVLPPQWIVPETRTDPTLPADRQPVDLAARVRALAAMRFATPEGVEPDPRTASFADLIVACRGFGADTKSRDRFLGALRDTRPDVWDLCGSDLLQLGRDEFLTGAKWDPGKDHERDGILHAKPFRVDCEGKEPWTTIDASRLCQQGAAVFWADLEAIKDAENDYAKYPSNVGADYEFIRAVPGSYVKGKDPAGRPFSALRIEFQSDLPFPYTHYDCDLRILNRVGADGLVRCDIWSPSEDFYWMAGQDLFVPLRTVAGAFAGLFLVRVYGFDLDGVPDGEDAVREALRGSLGNLKRRSEAAFRASGAKPRTLEGAIPDFILRGVKPAK